MTRTPTRRQVNGHTLELLDTGLWMCLQCGHGYASPGEAEAIWCGDDVLSDRKAG